MQPFADPRTLPWRERQRRRIRRAALEALRPPPNATISEWADAHRFLTSDQSAIPGAWKTSRTPYLREIQDCLSPNCDVQEVVVMKGARVGYTEGPMGNAIGGFMHMAPCPIMIVQPSEADAEEWSKDSLDPMLASSPVLQNLVSPDAERKKGNTILHKRYRAGKISIVSASTGKSFRRRLARVCIGDEIDAWPTTIDGEGDPLKLARKRTDTFRWTAKRLWGSTPTVKGHSRVERLFLDSDQRYYHVPCPDCRHLQQLVWSQVHWTDGDPKTAGYVCANPECGLLIPFHKKAWMLAEENGARWVATNPGASIRGYHLAGLYSPWTTWEKFVEEWIAAQGDPTAEQVFANTVLGETWDLANAERWSQEELRALRVRLSAVPQQAACLTAGVDVQGDRLVLVVDAWGPREERWTLLRRDLLGDPSAPEVWEELDAALLERFALEGGGSVGIKSVCIDSGGHHTQAVRAFCRTRKKRRIIPIKGKGGQGIPVWPRESKLRNKGRVEERIIGVDAAKEALHGRLRRSAAAVERGQPRGGPSFWHFASTLGEAFFEELTAEVQIAVHSSAKKGGVKSAAKWKWVLREAGRRNEALDCCVYSFAALQGLLALGAVKLDRPLRGKDEAPTHTLGKVVEIGSAGKGVSSRSPNLARQDETTISEEKGRGSVPAKAPEAAGGVSAVASAPPPAAPAKRPAKQKRPRFF